MQNTWRRGLALGNAPNARILGWRYQHVGILEPTRTVKFASPPTPNLKFALPPTPTPRCQSVEYRWRWVPNAKFSHWACTFHVVYVNFICVGHSTQTHFQCTCLSRRADSQGSWRHPPPPPHTHTHTRTYITHTFSRSGTPLNPLY